MSAVDNRAAFVALLRDSKQWPATFEWDYSACSSCAIGLLAGTLLPGTDSNILALTHYGREPNNLFDFLGLDYGTAWSIFVDAHKDIGRRNRIEVSAVDVANLLAAAPFSR